MKAEHLRRVIASTLDLFSEGEIDYRDKILIDSTLTSMFCYTTIGKYELETIPVEREDGIAADRVVIRMTHSGVCPRNREVNNCIECPYRVNHVIRGSIPVPVTKLDLDIFCIKEEYDNESVGF